MSTVSGGEPNDGGQSPAVLRHEIRGFTGWSERKLSAVAGTEVGDTTRLANLPELELL